MPALFLIEDNAPLRENTKVFLELNGYEVSEFDAGPPALEKLKEGTPDLVLCDILLPGMSGYDILGQVRKMPAGGEVPFIPFGSDTPKLASALFRGSLNSYS